MPVELSPEAWAHIRAAYEHTEQPVEDICIEHGISSGTLRDRMRRWKWARRRPPIPRAGPPPIPAAPVEAAPAMLAPGASSSPDAPQGGTAAPPAMAHNSGAPVDPATIGPRLQGALARVPQAIETVLGNLGSAAHPRELERAARALTALTRTLHELNTLLGQFPVRAEDERGPADDQEFIQELVRRMDAFAALHVPAQEVTSGSQSASECRERPVRDGCVDSHVSVE